MSLRRKMTLQILGMIFGLLLIGSASLWGLHGLNQDYGQAVAGYQELRRVFEVGSHLATARTLLASALPDRSGAMEEVATARSKFDIFMQEPGNGTVRLRPDSATAQIISHSLADAEAQLRSNASPAPDPAADASAVGRVLAEIGQLTSDIGRTIRANRDAAAEKQRTTTIVIGVIFAAIVLAAVPLGILQYRGVMIPLHRLSRGVRTLAAGKFNERLAPDGGEEFAMLARDFNRMAGELDGFCHQLEQKVAEKSKELIRSERLASVGYLAAGVAHEINNPLGIISGYAELMLEELGQKPGADAEVIKSLRIISDEAFRCKEITSKLLSLARSGDNQRSEVNLARVADSVVEIVGGLRQYRGRRLTVEADTRADLRVTAVEAEMKQVVLNLALNALEAAPSRDGLVRIGVERRNGLVELSVTDNGRGMTPDTLERVFEPFFTERRTSQHAGTGLGLAITHAIVEDHGGSIRASSEGPLRGSRFVVAMPAAHRQETS